jgi:hypothetical protein
MTLFDGSDAARSYDLHDDSHPQNLRFRGNVPSQFKIRNISPAGSKMTVDVEIPPPKGLIIRKKGAVKMLRVHEHDTCYGPPGHQLKEDCIITLDSEPGLAFGLDISGANTPAGKRMLNLLREAFHQRFPIEIEYEATATIGGRIIRVIKTV